MRFLPPINPENQSWFYAKDDEQHGPVPFLQIKNMIASGQLNAEDLVWNESLDDWIPFLQIKNLVASGQLAVDDLVWNDTLDSWIAYREVTAKLAAPQIAAAPLQSETEPLPIPADLKPASFLKLMILGAAAFVILVGFGASLAFSFGSTGTPFDSFLTPLAVIAGIAALGVVIWGVVLAMIYLHRAWRMIQGFGASITPGIAVGFLFIPLFTLYWHFRSYLNWSREYNDIVARNPSLQMAPRASEGVFLTFCICQLISGILDIIENFEESIALVGGLVSLGSLVCMVMVFFQICNAINFFIEVRDRQAMERQTGI